MNSRMAFPTWLLLACPAFAQFDYGTDGLPAGPGVSSYTEALDFGDVDLDGDWDVAFADGGDFGLDQNRLWINGGGLQSGVEGTFTDETSSRCPLQTDASRDVEFADIDGDGDPDVYFANNSSLVSQTSRFWVNQGGLQGGALGFFTDETAQRWVNLGQLGSSLPSFATLPGGGFIDWSADGDFADLDNDGDLDLIHTSDGNLLAGTPSRVFLNDGSGFFEEFNPSGVQLAGFGIPTGTPALWVQGVQDSNSTDPTGGLTDISAATQDVQVGDIDGDLELDILLGGLFQAPRLFRNLKGSPDGALGFHDVTFAIFDPGFVLPSWKWDQELGDLDGDGDLDLVGSGWGATDAPSTFTDRIYRGDGAGGFEVLQLQVPDSEQESEQIDLVDFDNDGDLDVARAEFTTGNLLFENDGTGALILSDLNFPAPGSPRHDVESADLDGDGDADLMLATRAANGIAWNACGVPDTTAPWFGAIEPAEDRSSSEGAFPLRAALYDNAPFELYDGLRVSLRASVAGCLVSDSAARHSGGQIFRTEVPANLLGEVELRWRGEDENGNVSFSTPTTYIATTALDVSNEFGLGSASAVTGVVPTLTCATVPFSGTSIALCLKGAPDAGYLLGVYSSSAEPPLVLPGLGVVNVSGVQLAFVAGSLDAFGRGVWTSGLPVGLPPGLELFAQAFTTEGSVPGDLFSNTRGLAVRTF